jgi:hypothetical protein
VRLAYTKGMNNNLVKTKSGELHEIQYVVHPRPLHVASGDVYACYRISATDGMPIGPLVWIATIDLMDSDQKRLLHSNMPRNRR